MGVALLLLPDFLLIVGGALLKRGRGFGAPFWTGVERLVYFVLFPALLFRSLAQAPLALGGAGRLVAVALAFTLAGMALSALARPLFGLPRPTFAACFQCGFRFNTYIALAAASRIAGESGLAMISLLVGVLVPVVNCAAVGMLAEGHRGQIALQLAKNPLVLACLAGFAWQVGGWPLPETAAHLLALLGSAALQLGLLAVGAGLSLARGTLPLPALAWWSGVKLVALPAIAPPRSSRATSLPKALRSFASCFSTKTTPSSAQLPRPLPARTSPARATIRVLAVRPPIWPRPWWISCWNGASTSVTISPGRWT